MSGMRIAVTAVATVERLRAAKGSAPTTSSVADPHLVLRGRSRAGDDGRVRTGFRWPWKRIRHHRSRPEGSTD